MKWLTVCALAVATCSVAGSVQAAPMGPGSARVGSEANGLLEQVHRRPWSHCHSTPGYPYCHSNYLRGSRDPNWRTDRSGDQTRTWCARHQRFEWL